MNLEKAIDGTDWSDIWTEWRPTTGSLSSIWTFNRKRLSYVYYKLLELEEPDLFPAKYLNLRGPAYTMPLEILGWKFLFVAFHGWLDLFILGNGGRHLTKSDFQELTYNIDSAFLELLAQDHYDVVNVISKGNTGNLFLEWKEKGINPFYGARFRGILFDCFVDTRNSNILLDGFNIITGTSEKIEDGLGRIPNMINIIFHPNQISYWTSLDIPLPLNIYTGNDKEVFERNFLKFLWLPD